LNQGGDDNAMNEKAVAKDAVSIEVGEENVMEETTAVTEALPHSPITSGNGIQHLKVT
jgi:hypothetical protein